MAVTNPERYASAEDLSAIFTKIETKLSNRYTKAATDSAIASAISGVTQFDYQIVQELPSTGTKGVIYLVANTGTGSNLYDEYIWIVVSDEGHFEKIGYKEIDISGKLENSDVKVTANQITKTNDQSGNGFTLALDSAVTGKLAEVDDKLENTDVKVNSTRLSKTNDGSGNGFTVDLSSSVQTSLGLADTAVQPAAIAGFLENGDVKVNTTRLAKTDDVSGNGFTVDLSSAVQTSLGKADSALQSSNVDGETVKWDSTNSELYVGIDGTTIVKDSTTGVLKVSDDFQLNVDHLTTEQINTLKAIFTDDPSANSGS